MSLLFKYPISGKNFSTTSRNGRRVADEKAFTFDGDIQPISSRTTLALTAGRISSGMVRVFSEISLVVATEGDSETAKGSYVLHEGSWYEIVTEASWNSKSPELESINHYDYYAEYREKEVA